MKCLLRCGHVCGHDERGWQIFAQSFMTGQPSCLSLIFRNEVNALYLILLIQWIHRKGTFVYLSSIR